jgi:hypothetical protein
MGVEHVHLSIDFEDLVEAFEWSDVMHHYFIDTKENTLIYINEDLDEDAEEQLEKMQDDRYLIIPPRLPQDNFVIMEMFVSEKIQDASIAERFNQVLERKKPFKNFKDLLLDYPDLREQWFAYKDRNLRNETINWLCDANISLTNQRLILEIEIRELTKDEMNLLDGEVADFIPVRCMNCQNEEGLTRRLFKINAFPENLLIEQETKQIMQEKFNIGHYGWWSGKKINILTVSKCLKCQSEHVFWDY